MTKEPKWTEGPLDVVSGVESGELFLVTSNEVATAKVVGGDGKDWLVDEDESRANAYLYAAAPELYEALDEVIKEASSHVMLLSGLMPLHHLKSDSVQDGHKKLSDKLQRGRDALSKALGERE